MAVVIISGSVATGKTFIAKKLAKEIGFKYLDVNKIILEKKLRESYDRKKKCYVVDTKRLNNVLIDLIKSKEKLVVDSHLSHYLPKRYVDLCIITKCDLKILEGRLKKRKYIKSKIRENLDAEIFDVCLNEAKEAGHKVIVVDTSKKVNVGDLKKKILNKLRT